MNPLVAANPSQSPFQLQFLKLLAVIATVFIGLLPAAHAAVSSSVTLAWNPNPEPNVARYELKWGTASGVYSNQLNAGSSTTATASALSPGVTYYFAVVAYNVFGQASPPSAEIAYTVPGQPNTAPSAGSFSVTVAEDGQAAATLTGSDPEGDPLAYSIVSSPSKGTLAGTAPNLTYRPNANVHGSDSFAYRVSDGVLISSTATVSITITPVNDAPVAAAKSVTASQNTNVPVTLSGSDVDGDPLTYIVVSNPSKGTLSGTAPNLTYRANAGATGSDSFSYRVNDGTVNSATATVSISIVAGNTAPVAHGKAMSTMKNKPVNVELSGTDADGNPLTYSITSQPATGTLSGNPPNVKYIPEKKWTGDVSFSYRVNDGTVNSAPATVNIKVKDKNRRPVATPASVVANQNGSRQITLTGTDSDNDPLSFEIAKAPRNGSISGISPNFTYTPKPGFKGQDKFTFKATDGVAKSKAATVDINVVNPNNRAPVAVAMNLSGPIKKKVTILAQGSDADGDPLTFRVVSGPVVGKVSGRKGKFGYKPPGTFEGVVSFTYVANDGVLDSAPATVTITIGEPSVSATSRTLVVVEPAQPSLAVRSLPGEPDQMQIEMTGVPGQKYTLEVSTDLSKWASDREILMDAGGTATINVPGLAGTTCCFYRLRSGLYSSE